MLRVNMSRLKERMDTVNSFGTRDGSSAQDGVNRLSYTVADMDARRWFMAEMEAIGLTVRPLSFVVARPPVLR